MLSAGKMQGEAVTYAVIDTNTDGMVGLRQTPATAWLAVSSPLPSVAAAQTSCLSHGLFFLLIPRPAAMFTYQHIYEFNTGSSVGWLMTEYTPWSVIWCQSQEHIWTLGFIIITSNAVSEGGIHIKQQIYTITMWRNICVYMWYLVCRNDRHIFPWHLFPRRHRGLHCLSTPMEKHVPVLTNTRHRP